MHSILIAAFLSSLLAQAPPDGETIVKRVAEMADKRQNIEYVFGISAEAKIGNNTAPAPPVLPSVALIMANPGKMRIEAGTTLRLTDGSTTWTYDSSTKQYTKTNAGQRLNLLALPALDWFYRGAPSISDFAGTPKLLREETIEVSGTRHDCWVVQDALKIPDSVSARYPEANVTSWIDKEMFIPLKNELSLAVAGNPRPELKFILTLRSFKIDQSIAADKFTFTPPDASREVQDNAAQLNLTDTAAPAFTVKDLEGKSYTLDSLKGKTVFLDFWATWCGPCAKSTPALERINAEFAPKGLVMLAVDVGEDRKIVEAFLKPRSMRYPVVIGDEFGIDRAFQVHVFPTFMVIAPDGKIAAHEIGWNDAGGEARLRGMIAKADATGSPAPVSANRAEAPVSIPYVPAGIAVDNAGNLHISDSGGARVIKVSPSGAPVVVAGNGAHAFSGDGRPGIFASLERPLTLAVDAGGTLYIADNGTITHIRKLAPDGLMTSLDIPKLQRVGGLAVDAASNLYFSEPLANRIRKFGADGKVTTIAGTGIPGSRGDGGPAAAALLASPAGLAFDAVGTLYVADAGNHRVRKILTDGTILLAAGNGSEGVSGDGGFAVLAQVKNPTAVAVDPGGNLYIADPGAGRIRKVSPDGKITTIAGTFDSVVSLAADTKGNLYLADTPNARVRRIDAGGTINTVPGTAGGPQ